MITKQSWIAVGAVIGGLAGVVANLTMSSAGRAVGPAFLAAGIVIGAIMGNRRR